MQNECRRNGQEQQPLFLGTFVTYFLILIFLSAEMPVVIVEDLSPAFLATSSASVLFQIFHGIASFAASFAYEPSATIVFFGFRQILYFH